MRRETRLEGGAGNVSRVWRPLPEVEGARFPTDKLIYISNNDPSAREPGFVFSVYTVMGLHEAGADCVLMLPSRTFLRHTSVLFRERLGFEPEFPVWALFIPRILGTKILFPLRAFISVLRSDRTILISRVLKILPWALLLRKLRGTRVYFEAHDFWTDPSLRPDEITPGRWKQARMEQKWLARVDGIICVSEPQAALYRCYYPSIPVLTALTGTRPVTSKPRKDFTYTLGYIGSFTESKYPLPLVLQALSSVTQPPVRLLCIGYKNEEERMRLFNETKRLGLTDRVEIHPWCSGETLDRLKRRIDVGIAVLSDTFLNRIASPLKVLEYLSMTLPVIATRLPGIEAMIKNGEEGFLVENDSKEWENAIRRIYADFSAYQRMSRRCKALAESMGWDQRGRTIVEALKSGIFSGLPSRQGFR